jgi:phospholysine phosphohistidine inorganic pyrophosphate phosphatase
MPASVAAGNVLLIDLDGVMYQQGELIPGAIEALAWIRSERIPHLFVTNTTSRSRAGLLQRFANLGFEADIDEIMTPAVAACRWLESEGLRRIAAFVPPATQSEFEAFELTPLDGEVPTDAVVIGDLGAAWDFRLLDCAFRMLMQDPAPRLLALGMTRYWRGRQGLQLDVAPFVNALEHAASAEAVVVGKPAAAFFDAALDTLGAEASQALMIGDDIVGDVDAAQRHRIRGIQVRTGKFRPADLDGDIEPFAVIDSFADLPDWWRANLAAGEP